MKKHISLLSFVAVSLVALNTWAIPAVYYSGPEKTPIAVDTFREKKDGSYKIWFHVDDKYSSRDVLKSELTFATFDTLDGQKDGQQALMLNSETGALEHCKISNVFDNHTMNLFCDLYVDGIASRHYYNVAPTVNGIPEVSGDIDGYAVGQRAHINGEALVGSRILGVGTKVRIRALFKNGKILVQEDPKFPEFAPNGPTGEDESFLVNSSDLDK